MASVLRGRRFKYLLAGLVCAGLVGIGCWYLISRSNAALPAGISHAQYRDAAHRCRKRRGRQPDQGDIFFELAHSALAAGRTRRAAACLRRIPSRHPRYGREARLLQGELSFQLRKASECERQLKSYLRLASASPSPDSRGRLKARRLLNDLLIAQLRFEERHRILKGMVQRDEADTFETLDYCFPSLATATNPLAVSLVEEFLDKQPDCLSLRVALGQHRIAQGRLEEARNVLQQCCRERPENLRAKAALLLCLYKQRRDERLRAVFETLPARNGSEPWLLMRMRGHVLLRLGERRQALKAYRAALEADPANPEVYRGLVKAYRGLGLSDKQEQAADRVRLLARIRTKISLLHEGLETPENALFQIARLAEQAGLPTRALLVAGMIDRAPGSDPELAAFLARLRGAARNE